MPDKDAVIIEASVLLVTLMFVILSIWTSKDPQSADAVRELQKMIDFVYGVGLLFTSAAFIAAAHMFGEPLGLQAGTLKGIEKAGTVVFLLALAFLGTMFFLNTGTYFKSVFAIGAVILVLWAANAHLKEGKP